MRSIVLPAWLAGRWSARPCVGRPPHQQAAASSHPGARPAPPCMPAACPRPRAARRACGASMWDACLLYDAARQRLGVWRRQQRCPATAAACLAPRRARSSRSRLPACLLLKKRRRLLLLLPQPDHAAAGWRWWGGAAAPALCLLVRWLRGCRPAAARAGRGAASLAATLRCCCRLVGRVARLALSARRSCCCCARRWGAARLRRLSKPKNIY